jgi:FMN-dependent NADH-azoreductase
MPNLLVINGSSAREDSISRILVEETVARPHLAADRLAGVRAWFDYLLRAGETFSYSELGPNGLITHLLRAGETFSYSELGPNGLITRKRALVVERRGGLYSEGPGRTLDFQEPYLRRLLGFIGITDVTFHSRRKDGVRPRFPRRGDRVAKTHIAAVTHTPQNGAA